MRTSTKIPLNSLVFCEKPKFPIFECLSLDEIEIDLVGSLEHYLSDIAFDELCHRVNVKLGIGQRAVITDKLNSAKKHILIQIANSYGVPVIEADSDAEPVLIPDLNNLSDQWDGITVVGDLHGDIRSFKSMTEWSLARNHFIVLLGDIIDYGPDSIELMFQIYQLVMNGDAVMVIGNHERKIAKWLEQRGRGKTHIKLSEGNKITVRAFEALTEHQQQKWTGQFKNLLFHSKFLYRIDDIVFTHAAVYPNFWIKMDDPMVEKFSIYGESEQRSGKYTPTYKWIDSIPKNKTVMIGHNIIDQYPLVKTGERGGQAVFLDTGCGKGGHLSSADLRFRNNKLQLECFKRY